MTLPGSFRWQILSTPDPSGAGNFYRQLFDWEVGDGPAPSLAHDGKRVGYIMNRADDARARKRPPNWLPVVGALDVDATLERATSLGGEAVEDVQVPEGPRIGRIQSPTGCCNNNVNPAFQRAYLVFHGCTAVYRQRNYAKGTPVFVYGLRHLHGKFACGYKDQRGCALTRGCCCSDAVEQRKCERSGFSGAGGSLTKQVASRQQWRNCLLLHGGGFLVAERCQLRQDLLIYAE
jgi:predicted enzyme related to lactoylglutathione lyase